MSSLPSLSRLTGNPHTPITSPSWLTLQAQKPVQVTCPFGTLDPLMDRAHLAAFPVPSGLLQATTELHTDAQRNGLDATQYGQSFCSTAFKGNAAAILAAAQRQADLLYVAAGCCTVAGVCLVLVSGALAPCARQSCSASLLWLCAGCAVQNRLPFD